jgi:hypothetical protein
VAPGSRERQGEALAQPRMSGMGKGDGSDKQGPHVSERGERRLVRGRLGRARGSSLWAGAGQRGEN